MRPRVQGVKSRPTLLNITMQLNRNRVMPNVNAAEYYKYCKVWILTAWVSAINITSLSVNSLRDKVCKADIDFRICRMGFTSQVSIYLGLEGFKLKMPFMNLKTSGWDPTLQPSRTMPND